jgi:exosome complex RNA-binding protein Rrp4
LQVDENIGFSTAAGRLEIVTNKKESKKLVIRHVKSIYFPKENDTIIGIIVKRNAENYGVDISM